MAHVWAQNGYHLYLAGRKAASEIAPDVQDVSIRYGITAKALEFDALAYETHDAFYAALEPKPDVVICVLGYMPDQKESEKDPSLARAVMATNYVGCANILGIAAYDMEARKSGSIIGISSVAGERGRASNYLYGSAKAGFTAFLSGLRNRMALVGLHVMTVKPGFVYTKMTEGLPLPAPLTATPEKVAQDVFKAWKKKKNVLYTKWMWRWIMAIIRSIPEWKFKKMKL
ncbi:MAG: SDR family oxidoreductase [Bacteroidia bacterium]|nr:SDR family oxidoreductase [Bacteroidia bacterium]